MSKRNAEWWRNYRARRKSKSAATPVAPATPATPATPVVPVAQPAQPRRRRVKDDKQIRNYIAGAMRQFGTQPQAFLNVMTGYVAQLQDEMKRETEDTFSERACQGRHPGRVATGLYCKLCHDTEMAGRFAAMPPEFNKGAAHAGDLIFPSEEKRQNTEDEDDLSGIVLKV